MLTAFYKCKYILQILLGWTQRIGENYFKRSLQKKGFYLMTEIWVCTLVCTIYYLSADKEFSGISLFDLSKEDEKIFLQLFKLGNWIGNDS